MSHSREYVEGFIVNRLTKARPGDVPVTETEFRSVALMLMPEYERILGRTNIPGFTDDDLLSFMFMKTHQMLRTGMMADHIPGTRPHKMFGIAITNLMRDIIRMQESAHRRGMYLDALDTRADGHIDADKATLLIMNV